MCLVASNDTPTHRMSAEDRRRQLIEVAIDLFSRKGFDGTTTKEIAAAAGVTEAIIFRHFATKQDLHTAILDYKCGADLMDNWLLELEALTQVDDDEGLVRLLVTKIIQHLREDPRFERLLLFAALEGNELALLHHTRTKLPIVEKLISYIARRQEAGAMRPGQPIVILFALVGIPQFYALQKYVYQSPLIGGTDEQVVENFVRIVMDGLRPAAPNRATE